MAAWNPLPYRPKPFYFLTTTDPQALSAAAVAEALADLKAAGYGGCVLFNKPPGGFTREQYLGEAWFRAIRHFAEQALPLGLEIWVNDGFDFPPGDAGGRVRARAPHLGQQRLEPTPGGGVTVCEVEWGFPAFEEPESSRLFIEIAYEEYARRLGDLFGNGITGFFSDADNRRVPHGSMTSTYFPWSRGFAASFEAGHGYPIEPHLPAIVRGSTGPEAAAYWRHASRLYQQWFANNHDWCRRHGLRYTFHTSDTGPFTPAEMVRTSAFSEGAPLDLFAHSDLPGTDHELRALNGGTHFLPGKLWYNEQATWGQPACSRSPQFSRVRGDVRAKLAASAAFLLGREGALCECFAASNWSVETAELRRIAAWQIMQGITHLVPHAVHHRFAGSTKYFAPPEFLRCGALRESLRDLNDELADLCAIASLGQLQAPVAVLDPTAGLWRTGAPCPTFFDVCAALNRLPQGYVVAPAETVLEQAARFRVAIDTTGSLPPKTCQRLTAAGITLVPPGQLDRLPALLPVESEYTGSGRPHFMRRQLDDGELLLIANIEDDDELRGTVRHAGRDYPVSLQPGEVAAFAPGWQRYRPPVTETASLDLPAVAPVTWLGPNRVSLFRWEDADGRVLGPDAVRSANGLQFRWRNAEPIPELRLLAPVGTLDEAQLDGRQLPPGEPVSQHDEPYMAIALPGSGASGDHLLVLRCQRYVPTSPCFLEGEFDCSVETTGPTAEGLAYYNFRLLLPATARVTLSRRSSTLDLSRSWAEQGHPFYSGAAVYQLDFAIPGSYRRPALRCGHAHCRVELTINGRAVGGRAFPPYDFVLTGFAGDCRAELTVESTLGNRFDGYGAPAGLADAPRLVDLALPPGVAISRHERYP